MYNHVSVGDSLEVRSGANGGRSRVHGVVVGMGSRIVELPLRLRKVPEILVYGREVTIRIPEKNGFLLGEMTAIQILPSWKKLLPGERHD